MVGYGSRQPLRDHTLLTTMQRLARQHPRYGYRRIWALLRRQGAPVNHKRVYRLWHRQGFSLPRRHHRKRREAPAPRPPEATRPHELWADAFVHDRCANGAALKCLVVVDEYTRLGLAIEVGGRLAAEQVMAALARLIEVYGVPRYLRSDNGPELVAHAVKAWLSTSGIATAYIDRGKPWQNGTSESFIGKFRDECRNMEWLVGGLEARVMIEGYRREYKEGGPKSNV